MASLAGIDSCLRSFLACTNSCPVFAQRGTVLLHDPSTKHWLRFANPLDVLEAHSVAEVMPLLHRVERLVNSESRVAAGLVAYEAAPAFDSALCAHKDPQFPLAWFGIFKAPEVLPQLPIAATPASLSWEFPLSLDEYRTAIDRIRNYIHRGDTYQVNYTFRLKAAARQNAFGLFAGMVGAQPAQYAAFIETKSFCICSASPELFF